MSASNVRLDPLGYRVLHGDPPRPERAPTLADARRLVKQVRDAIENGRGHRWRVEAVAHLRDLDAVLVAFDKGRGP